MKHLAQCFDNKATRVNLEGKILEKRYVILEEVGPDGEGLLYQAYDLTSLGRVHIRIDPDSDNKLSGEVFSVVDSSPPPKMEISPPEKTPAATSSTPDEAPEPMSSSLKNALAATKSSADKTPAEGCSLEQALERALEQDEDPNNVTQSIDLSTVEEVHDDQPKLFEVKSTKPESKGRQRIRTRQIEAAWFARGDQLEEEEASVEDLEEAGLDHEELVRQAAELSLEEYRKYSLDLAPPPPPVGMMEAFLSVKPQHLIQELASQQQTASDPDPIVKDPMPSQDPLPAQDPPPAQDPLPVQDSPPVQDPPPAKVLPPPVAIVPQESIQVQGPRIVTELPRPDLSTASTRIATQIPKAIAQTSLSIAQTSLSIAHRARAMATQRNQTATFAVGLLLGGVAVGLLMLLIFKQGQSDPAIAASHQDSKGVTATRSKQPGSPPAIPGQEPKSQEPDEQEPVGQGPEEPGPDEQGPDEQGPEKQGPDEQEPDEQEPDEQEQKLSSVAKKKITKPRPRLTRKQKRKVKRYVRQARKALKRHRYRRARLLAYRALGIDSTDRSAARILYKARLRRSH